MPPKIGDKVLCDGGIHEVVDPAKHMGEDKAQQFLSAGCIMYENKDYRRVGLAADLEWDEEDGHWYLKGRLLSQSDRRLIAEMRDRGVLPSTSKTRKPGDVPMPEEHYDLHKTFCRGKPKGYLHTEVA